MTGTPRRLLAQLLIFTFILSAAHFAGAEMADWEELSLPAGGRLIVVRTEGSGSVCVGLAFPAGTAQSPKDPAMAWLAPLLFADREPGGALDSLLSGGQWSLKTSTSLDGAGVFLTGPAASSDRAVDLLLDRLEGVLNFDDAALGRAWTALESLWERWGGNSEVALRAEMAKAAYGEHPYRNFLGQHRPADASPPALPVMLAWLREHYQAGSLTAVIAGNLRPLEFLERWQPRFDRLEGKRPAAVRHPRLVAGKARIEMPTEGSALMILQFPGPPGGSREAVALSLVAGVLSHFLKADLMQAGLARSAIAWYDFMAPGSRPLEIQVRDFDPSNREKIEALVYRFVDRLRSGEYSQYQVISAKDLVFGQLDRASRKGSGPTNATEGALQRWTQSVARQSLHYPRWSNAFEKQMLGGVGKQEIAVEAAARLIPGNETFGLLLPE